jgi:hypothetical protein
MSTNKTTPSMAEPESFDEVMRSLQRSVSLVLDSPALTMSRTITQLANDMVKTHQNTFADILKNMPKITMPSSTLYLPHLPSVDTKIDVELVGGSDVLVSDATSKAKISQTERKTQHQRPKFSLYFLEASGSVKYKRKTLKALSLDTQHGRLLKMFIEAEGHFVPDGKLLAVFEKDVIYEVGYILRNLKKAFSANGLEIIIEHRPKSNGYVLIDIQTLQ